MKFNATPEFAGLTFPKRDPAEVMEELDRQAKARKDMVVHTTSMEMKPSEQHGLVLEATVGKETLSLPMTKGTLSQLSTDIGINQRSRLYYRLRHGTADLREARRNGNGNGSPSNGSELDTTRYYGLWCEIVNDVLRTEKRKRLLRGMANKDGEMYWRAYLRSAALEAVRRSAAHVHRGVDDIRVVRIKNDIAGPGVLVDSQNGLPGLSAVAGLVDAALVVGSPEVTQRRDKADVRVARVNGQGGDVV